MKTVVTWASSALHRAATVRVALGCVAAGRCAAVRRYRSTAYYYRHPTSLLACIALPVPASDSGLMNALHSYSFYAY